MKDNNGRCQYFPWAGLPLQGFYQYSSAGCYKTFILKPLGGGGPQNAMAGVGARAVSCLLSAPGTSSPLERQISFAFLKLKEERYQG